MNVAAGSGTGSRQYACYVWVQVGAVVQERLLGISPPFNQ
jgi:hypothetical protein